MPDLPKLNGPEPTASAFADAWCRRTGATRTLGMRQRGYATAAVAALSRRLLAGKSYCCPNTDLANPTSNAIYRKIGYRAVADFNDHHLEMAR